MTTYFAWREKEEVFNRSLHERCDLDILELIIDHREGEVALATVVIAETTLPSWDKRYIYISSEGTLLFSGRLVGLPYKIQKNLVSLEFTAEPFNAFEQLRELEKEVKKPPFWDAAFVDQNDYDNPAQWLDARSALFSWDRTNGTVCLSDLFEGRNLMDFSDQFFTDTLKVNLAETPLSQITVSLTAEWTQQASGEINVGGKIGAAFPGGILNTLTPHALQTTWPQEGQKLGFSGYRVLKSQLKEINPPRTGILDIYPTLTPEFLSWNEQMQAPKHQRAKRFWLCTHLVLGWQYRQKRREIVRFTLEQDTQFKNTIRPLTRTLHLRLQELRTPEDISASSDTFFLTFRGRQALEHALEIARAHLAATARCLEIEFMFPFECGFGLSTDLSVRLKDPRIPGGEVTGKVVAYQLKQKGTKAFSWVRLAASVGKNTEPLPPPDQTLYVAKGYGDTSIPSSYQTASGISYDNYSHQHPQEGIRNLENLSLYDILRNVYVSHDAQGQIQFLQTQQYPVQQNIEVALEKIPTIISLDLLSLKTKAVLENTIHISTRPWVAPQQFELSGSISHAI